jgi:hypothetical protein
VTILLTKDSIANTSFTQDIWRQGYVLAIGDSGASTLPEPPPSKRADVHDTADNCLKLLTVSNGVTEDERADSIESDANKLLNGFPVHCSSRVLEFGYLG